MTANSTVAPEPFAQHIVTIAFGGAVQAQFFRGVDQKSLTRHPTSWRALALVQARQVAPALLPQASRNPLAMLQAPATPQEIHLLQRLSAPGFIRALERFGYPGILQQALEAIWSTLARYIGATLVEAGRRFLEAQEALKERLRAGGLFPEEKAALDVLTLGVLAGEMAPGWYHALLRSWLRRARPPVAGPEVAGLECRVAHRPLGLRVDTRYRERSILLTEVGADGDARLALAPGALPAGTELTSVADAHVDRFATEAARRARWLAVTGRILDLVVTYMVLGPAGLMVMALRLLAEGLLQVAGNGEFRLAS